MFVNCVHAPRVTYAPGRCREDHPNLTIAGMIVVIEKTDGVVCYVSPVGRVVFDFHIAVS